MLSGPVLNLHRSQAYFAGIETPDPAASIADEEAAFVVNIQGHTLEYLPPGIYPHFLSQGYAGLFPGLPDRREAFVLPAFIPFFQAG